MIGILTEVLRPLNSLRIIAQELSAIRELYELELAARERPIYRTTEQAKKSDTEVSYAGMPVAKKSSWKWLAQAEDDEIEEEEEAD